MSGKEGSAASDKLSSMPPLAEGEEPRPVAARSFESEPRLAVSLWAHCEVDGGVSQEALGELAPRDFLLRSKRPVKPGARIRVAVGLPFLGGTRVCSLSGRVAWTEADEEEPSVIRAGVSLDHETDETDRELLDGFLSLWTSREGLDASSTDDPAQPRESPADRVPNPSPKNPDKLPDS